MGSAPLLGTRVLLVVFAVLVLGGVTWLEATMLVRSGANVGIVVGLCVAPMVLGFAAARVRLALLESKRSRMGPLESPPYPKPFGDRQILTVWAWGIPIVVLITVLQQAPGLMWWVFALYTSVLLGLTIGLAVFLTPGVDDRRLRR